MSNFDYSPAPAFGATAEPDGELYRLAIVRDLKHAPERVWGALTEPGQLSAWAPFDASGNLGVPGAAVTLTQGEREAETVVTEAVPPVRLAYQWGDMDLRWELEATETGTRLKLWAKIRRPFVAMGAAGWHVCLDVMDHLLAGSPVGRIVGNDAMGFPGWQRLVQEYSAQFGVPVPNWIPSEGP